MQSVGHLKKLATLLAIPVLFAACRTRKEFYFCDQREEPFFQNVATDIEYPCIAECPNPQVDDSQAPRTIEDASRKEYWNLTLQEAVQIALGESKVMRDLGGRLINSPGAAPTVFDPAIRESDPRYGVDAALSAFDAQLATRVFWERNDRALNNPFEGGGTRLLDQDLGTFQSQISKRAATGTLFSLRNNTDYEWSNVESNTFPSAWTTLFDAEVRQPLLQGNGIAFNRIAGPAATPGFYFSSGVLVARINTDISLADFEAGVRNVVSDVENAYWDLYFAYRDLDAKIVARDSALNTWRAIQARYASGQPGGDAVREAQAREQYFVFQAQVEDALSGSSGRGTFSGSGSGGGAFRAGGGVYATERRLRLIMGISMNDGRLIRPADEPAAAKVLFDWQAVRGEALARRVELRRQRWQVKRRELELVAAKNFVLPRLDVVSRYRWRGFGNNLIDYDDAERFDNAFQNLTDGDFQEWQMGVELNLPIGYRQGYAGVRNAQLLVARERAVLEDQELQITHDLSNAIAELDRDFVLTRTNFNRRVASREQYEAISVQFDNDLVPLDLLLDAQRRLAEAESAYYRSQAEYAVALKNVHFEKGSLLDYNQVFLSEGPWPIKAYQDAKGRARDRAHARPMNYGLTVPPPVSRGPVTAPLHAMPPGNLPVEVVPAPAPLSPSRLPEPNGRAQPAPNENLLDQEAPSPLPGPNDPPPPAPSQDSPEHAVPPPLPDPIAPMQPIRSSRKKTLLPLDALRSAVRRNIAHSPLKNAVAGVTDPKSR